MAGGDLLFHAARRRAVDRVHRRPRLDPGSNRSARTKAAKIVGPWRRLLFVTCGARSSLLAAGLFVVVQTAGEISVTDMIAGLEHLPRKSTRSSPWATAPAWRATLVVSLPGCVAWTGLCAVLSYVGTNAAAVAPAVTQVASVLEFGPRRLHGFFSRRRSLPRHAGVPPPESLELAVPPR